MGIDYIKSQIEEELNGAIDYAAKAHELEESNPEWAKEFREMAMQELGHATKLRSMIEEAHQEISRIYDDHEEELQILMMG